MTPAMDLAPDWFRAEFGKHTMSVLHDDGLYRHLRFQRDDSRFYWFDIVTWPGHLVVGGDIDHFHFSRIRDMFEFFCGERQAPGINPHYWAQKLQGITRGSRQATDYSEDALRRRLRDWAYDEALYNDDVEMYPSLLYGAIDRLLAGRDPDFIGADEQVYHENGAHELLRELEEEIGLYDTWDWELRDYSMHFLRACWAIVWGIEQYRAAVPIGAAA